MGIRDATVEELLRIVSQPPPPRPLGKARAAKSQFEQFLREERLKGARNGKPVGSAPIAGWYKYYRHWLAECHFVPAPKLIPPFTFTSLLRRAGFKRCCRARDGYADQRLIGTDAQTAKKIREFLQQNPITKDDLWLYDPRRGWKRPRPL